MLLRCIKRRMKAPTSGAFPHQRGEGVWSWRRPEAQTFTTTGLPANRARSTLAPVIGSGLVFLAAVLVAGVVAARDTGGARAVATGTGPVISLAGTCGAGREPAPA